VDDIVLQAMTKWPDVPNVYGWLRLDRRGCDSLAARPFAGAAATRRSAISFYGDIRG